MKQQPLLKYLFLILFAAVVSAAQADPSMTADQASKPEQLYLIGPGDGLRVFVWANPDLSTDVVVRPDGLMTTPLVEDLQASGKTPTILARELEKKLSKFIRNPRVTITVTQFVGRTTEQIRVVGQAATPQALPYKEDMTALDVIIAVGGLTDFAAGNKSTIVRTENGTKTEISVRLDDLIRDGDISANVEMKPGDVLIIPESWF